MKIRIAKKASMSMKGRILVVYNSLEWWLCYVKEETQGYCKMVILRTDLAADQLSYLGSPWEVQLGEDISDYVAGLDNTLQSAVGYFGTATMLRNPYCDLRVAVGNPDVPLFMSPAALKRCRSLATLKKRDFFQKLGRPYYAKWFNVKEQCRRCFDTLASRPCWSLRFLLDLPNGIPPLPPFNLTVFEKPFLVAQVPFFLLVGRKWVEVKKLVFPKEGRAVQLSAVELSGSGRSFFAGFVTLAEFLRACEKARDLGELFFVTEKLPKSLMDQRKASISSPSTVAAASTLCSISKRKRESVGPKVIGKRRRKGPSLPVELPYLCEGGRRLVL